MLLHQRALWTWAVIGLIFFSSLLLKGHGSSMEGWTEEDCAHLPSPHGRSENTSVQPVLDQG